MSTLRVVIEEAVCWREKSAWDPGRASGTLFYVHGLGESGLCFERLMQRPELSDWNHCAADLPGYGKSAWPQRPASLPDLADLLCNWLPKAAPPVVVVGHSMGGVLGQLVCEKSPERVRAFVNVEGNISLQDCGFSGPAAAHTREEFLAVGMARLLQQVGRDGVQKPAYRSYHSSLALAWPEQFHLNACELVEISAKESLAKRFASLRVSPKIFLAGLAGGLGPRSLQLLKEAGAPWAGFENAGHWPFLDEEDRFVGVLLRFLSSVAEV